MDGCVRMDGWMERNTLERISLFPYSPLKGYFIDVLQEVREICDEFKDKGLPTYPSGIPFIFWEQYVWLRHNLFIAIIVILAVSFLVMIVVLCNLWAATIIVSYRVIFLCFQ